MTMQCVEFRQAPDTTNDVALYLTQKVSLIGERFKMYHLNVYFVLYRIYIL